MDCDDTQTFLHGYIDNELDLVNTLAIEAHLRTCSRCARDYTNQMSIHSAFQSGELYARAPPRLQRRVRATLRAGGPPARKIVPMRWIGLAASLVAIVTVVWILGPRSALLLTNQQLPQEVLADHVRSLMVDHLADVKSTDQHTVKPWFDGKLPFAPPVVDLADQGYPLSGGRLDYIDNQSVAALIYLRRLHVINVFIWPSAAEVAPETMTRQGYNLIHWESGGMTYWVISDLNDSELQDFGRLLRQQIAAPAATPPPAATP